MIMILQDSVLPMSIVYTCMTPIYLIHFSM